MAWTLTIIWLVCGLISMGTLAKHDGTLSRREVVGSIIFGVPFVVAGIVCWLFSDEIIWRRKDK